MNILQPIMSTTTERGYLFPSVEIAYVVAKISQGKWDGLNFVSFRHKNHPWRRVKSKTWNTTLEYVIAFLQSTEPKKYNEWCQVGDSCCIKTRLRRNEIAAINQAHRRNCFLVLRKQCVWQKYTKDIDRSLDLSRSH